MDSSDDEQAQQVYPQPKVLPPTARSIRQSAAPLLLAFCVLCCACCAPAAPIIGQVLSLDSPDQWLLSTDPANFGKPEQWWKQARPDAKPARVPGSMQETLGEYHGVAWYWRAVNIPRNPYPDAR